MDNSIASIKSKMEKTIQMLGKDFASVRTGRANPALIDGIKVDYYGTLTPINQLGNISVPEPRLMTITPYDKGVIKDLEKAIQASGIGLQPTNDGNIIRIVIPELTGDRRKELAKIVRAKAEEKKVAIRNIRRDALDELKKANNGESEDAIKSKQNEIQKLTDSFIEKVSDLLKAKEDEINTI